MHLRPVCASLFLALPFLIAQAHDGHGHGSPHDPQADAQWTWWAEQSRSGVDAKPDALPPAPEGVTDLAFSEFFGPVGRFGLEYSTKVKALAGKRVRLGGYMVRQEVVTPGQFLLATRPIQTNENEYGMCDDLPATVVHVLTNRPGDRPALVAGPLLLTGTLEVGPKLMADGRNSAVRLRLDAATFAEVALPAATIPAAHKDEVGHEPTH